MKESRRKEGGRDRDRNDKTKKNYENQKEEEE